MALLEDLTLTDSVEHVLHRAKRRDMHFYRFRYLSGWLDSQNLCEKQTRAWAIKCQETHERRGGELEKNT